MSIKRDHLSLVLKVSILLLLVIVSRPVKSACAQELPPTIVSVEPQVVDTELGQTFLVQVQVADVEALYGADIQLAFLPSVFEVIDADPLTEGTQIRVLYDFWQPSLIIKKSADNQAGTIWYAAALMNPADPVYGTGMLFEFEMRARQAGTFPLLFSNTQLAAPGGVAIPHEAHPGSIHVQGFSYYLPIITR